MPVENYDHIYVDDDGILRDSFIEHLFDEFFENKIDGLTVTNFRLYNTHLLGADSPSDEVFQDEDAAFVWVSNLGDLEVGLTADLPKDKMQPFAVGKPHYATLTSGGTVYGPVFAPTETCAILLSVVQLLRALFLLQYQKKVLQGQLYSRMN